MTIIYKGFIKATNSFYYPISEISRIEPLFYSPTKTKIIFKNGEYAISQLDLIKTIDKINENKE